jgi:general secretion pathway protein D
MKLYIGVILVLFVISCAGAGNSSLPYDMTLTNEGYSELMRENYEQAEAFFDLALSVNPNNPYALLNLGVVYQNTGRVEKAKLMYQKVIDMDSKVTAKNSTDSSFKGKSLAEIAKNNIKSLENN